MAVDDTFLWWIGALDRFTSLAAAVEHCCADGAGHRFVGLGGVAGASGGGQTMMNADLDELMLVSCLCPELVWSASSTRSVIVANDGAVLRLYWMPLLLWLDPFRAELFVSELNGRRKSVMSK